MSDPASLSTAFVDAFNRRDLDTIESMVAAETDYRRSGAETLSTPSEVRARYALDFETMPDVRARVVEVIAQTDTDVAFEIVVGTDAGELPGAAHHRWVDGRLVRYRSWVG